MLRISDVINLAMVSRKTIYNAINTGRLQYELVNFGNRQVRMFHEEAVYNAFPKAKRQKTQTQEEVTALRQEINTLKFALAELQKAIEIMDPSISHTMTSLNRLTTQNKSSEQTENTPENPTLASTSTSENM